MIRARHTAIARALPALCLAAWTCIAQAQEEPAIVRRASELREAANPASRSLANLPAQSSVVRLGERQGPWVQVRATGNQTGWVHMFDLAATAAVQPSNTATGGLRSVTNFLRGSGGTAPTTPTSTIGIRGLDAEDLANARPNPEAVARMESLRLNEMQARQFAAEAPLGATSVPPLPAPAIRPSGSTGAAGPAGARDAP